MKTYLKKDPDKWKFLVPLTDSFVHFKAILTSFYRFCFSCLWQRIFLIKWYTCHPRWKTILISVTSQSLWPATSCCSRLGTRWLAQSGLRSAAGVCLIRIEWWWVININKHREPCRRIWRHLPENAATVSVKKIDCSYWEHNSENGRASGRNTKKINYW